MTTDRFKGVKHVLLACTITMLLLFGSLVVDFNFLDMAYVMFILCCIVKYVIICRRS